MDKKEILKKLDDIFSLIYDAYGDLEDLIGELENE